MSAPGQKAMATPVKIPELITAVIGLFMAAFSLFVFVLDLVVTSEVEIGALVVSFVVCGMGLTTGFIVLRRLAPRREPMSLFGGQDGGEPGQPATRVDVRAQTIESQPGSIKNARPVHSNAQITPVMKSHGSESIATYKTHESPGALGLATAIGVCLVLGGRVAGGWEFLSLVVPAGSAVALVLYWSHSRQDANISGYKIPVAGGVIGFAALAGVGMVMVRFGFLRYFLGLAILAGGAIALGMNWSRRRREDSSSSFV